MTFNIHLKKGNCRICKNPLVIYRKYSKEMLCPKCFAKNIEMIIAQTISEFNMIKSGDRIIVGLSGGKDSIALLYNLKKIKEESNKSISLIALSIDEGIRDYRPKSIETAKNFCEEYKIKHKIISFKERLGKTLDEIIKIKRRSSNYRYSCNYCASIRKRLLNEGAKELKGDILALGHNLTDTSETFLMNVLYKRFQLIANQYLFKKESKLMTQFFIKKCAPLMKIPEEEIFLYANIKNLNYYSSHCPYREEDPILRKRVLNFIQECKKSHPKVEFDLFNGFLGLSKILNNHVHRIEQKFCLNCGYPCGVKDKCTYCTFTENLLYTN
ncbi:MAG: ATP-binding protein [Candidatus Hermodarchaeota archaeon]